MSAWRRLACIAFGALLAAAAAAQDFPARPVRLIVPIGPGGGTDILGRHVARKLGERLNSSVVVENRPGAGSLVGTEYAAKAAPDGYTLLVVASPHINLEILSTNKTYQLMRDFVPLGYVSAYPFVLIARSDLPASSLAELVDYARARPGKLTYGSAGIGTLQHVWGAILFKSLGLDLVHVPFKAAPAAHQEMLAGRLDVMIDNLSAAKAQVQAGRLKAFAVTGAQRSRELESVPTVNETGVARFEGESWFALFAPAATPASVVGTLRAALAEVLQDREFAERIERDGGRVLAVAPAEQRKFLEDEVERWSALVARYGVSID